MPSTTEKEFLDRATVSTRGGAGGEPLGEPLAPPPGVFERLSDEMRLKLPDELVDELLAGARTEDEIVGPGGLLAELTKRLVERALEVELTDHLGYEPHAEPPGGLGNIRNGSTGKTLITENGPVDTGVILDAIRVGKPLAEVESEASEAAGREVDVLDFAQALVELGFVSHVDDRRLGVDSPRMLNTGDLGPRLGALGRRLFSGVAWIVYVLLAVACAAILILSGEDEGQGRAVRERLLRAHSFTSYEQANVAWYSWNEEIARRRVHGTHGEIVAVRAERDRAALLALPPAAYLVVERTTRVIARDGFFSFEGRRYQVPDATPGERVELVLGPEEIEAYSLSDRRLLARHERGRPARVLPDPVEQSVPLARVLRAMPDPEVHRRPLSRYEEAIRSAS
jgi:hypothetical protein